MKPFSPRDWHYEFTDDRELPLIAWLSRSVDPTQPVAINGWNVFVIIKKMNDVLNNQERTITELLMLPLPDGRTVNELYKDWQETQKPRPSDAYGFVDNDPTTTGE